VEGVFFLIEKLVALGFFSYMAASENKKPGRMAIHKSSMRKVCEIKDKVILAVVKHGQKEKVPSEHNKLRW
jgi:hypothetical protein